MTHEPASRQSAFYWRDWPSTLAVELAPSNKDRSSEGQAKRYSPAIENREAGQRSMHKRDALRRGGI
jgi:hypothetical protein